MLDLPYGELRICAEVTPTIINSQVVPRHKNSGMAALEQRAMDGRLTVRVEDAAAIMGIKPQRLREQARTQDGRDNLGFPVSVAGRSILIPKLPFLRFWGYDGEVV